MRLKEFSSEVKSLKTNEKENIKNAMVLSVFKLEEILAEEGANTEKIVDQLGEVLTTSFSFANERGIEINNPEVEELDLDHWKDNIMSYKENTSDIVNAHVYLYTLRNALRYLIDEKDAINTKGYFFEIIIKTFLFINFLNLSIDSILNKVINKNKKLRAEIKKGDEELKQKEIPMPKENKDEIVEPLTNNTGEPQLEEPAQPVESFEPKATEEHIDVVKQKMETKTTVKNKIRE